MKRILFPIFLLCCILCGCGKPDAPVPTSLPAESLPDSIAAEAVASPMEAYGAVLAGKQGFYLNGSGEFLYISEISKAFTPEEMPWTVERLAVLDLHGDGVEEVILEVSDYVGFVILGYREDGDVCGQGIWYRAFQDLKADGTYMGSGSSFNHSYWKQHPSGEILLAECYEDTDGTPHYWVDGKETEATAFVAFEEAQQAKPNAQWYPTWQSYLESLS